MRTRTRSLLVLLAVSLASLPAAAIDRKTEERLQNIERKLESRGLVDMLNRLEQLQQDMQQLRGELELQTHRLDGIERRQREQYLDIDRRLQEIPRRRSTTRHWRYCARGVMRTRPSPSSSSWRGIRPVPSRPMPATGWARPTTSRGTSTSHWRPLPDW